MPDCGNPIHLEYNMSSNPSLMATNADEAQVGGDRNHCWVRSRHSVCPSQDGDAGIIRPMVQVRRQRLKLSHNLRKVTHVLVGGARH